MSRMEYLKYLVVQKCINALSLDSHYLLLLCAENPERFFEMGYWDACT